MTSPPPDELERRQATTTFDRNVVVTAGAGTGKTTLLVERCVNLLMREPHPVEVTELVALTFTNKAANEMKARLREELEVLARRDPGRPGSDDAAETQRIHTLCDRYRLTADEVHRRAREALQDLERAQIGTIHSFAASLLRLYPLEAGLDPRFQEDDGSLRRRRFETWWGLWLDDELSGTGSRNAAWKHVLGRFPLDLLRDLALALCAENVDLDELRLASPPGDAIDGWLQGLDAAVNDLIERHPENRKIERMLAAARKAIQSVLTGSPPVDAGELELLKGSPSRVSGWTDRDFRLARNVLADADALAQVDAAEVERLCTLLAPLVQRCRGEFARNGLVTFDGLLVRARDLLRDHPRIREELKARFKAILVDEFQDTDPLQYEILLWLCEERSQGAGNWREIRLVPGKLFVVGDPKQSIYGFRGADMEAYLNVVKEVIAAQNGVQYRLTANFRSDPRILDAVNGIFEHLIRERPGLQPEYIALQPGLDRADPEPSHPEAGGTPEGSPHPVRVRRVTSTGATGKAGAMRRLEAESLARWLEEEMLGRTFLDGRTGNQVPLQPGHVAFLMRTLTNVQVYLEALRRHGIAYVVEGERDFYAAQEVIDAVNLLRAIDNPHDRLALVGVLRSPVGGHDDAAIFDLHRRGLLDYRSAADSRWVDLSGNVMDLYQRLHRLHREARFLEAGKAVERVFKELPLSVVAAGGRSGQQAVANLEKVRLVAREAGAGGSGTLKDVVAELERRVRDREDESENALEEETLDAVRIMSVHRAKGLEFPLVVLADALGGVNRGPSSPVEVQRDWATGLTGIHIDDLWSLPGVFLRAKRREREAYEQRRLLYVAMTRPRQQLVVSFADRRGQDGDSLAGMIDEAAGGSLQGAAPGAVPCGAGEIKVEVVAETPGADEQGNPRPEPPPDTTDWSGYEQEWRRRWNEYENRRHTSLFVSPTRLKSAGEAAEAHSHRDGLGRDAALELGTLAHKVLEHWDFHTQRAGKDLDEAIARHAPELAAAQQQELIRELKSIWTVLTDSPVYGELQSARILGREVPFVLPWDDGAIMEGVIDVVYERDGQLYVADYKTDQVTGDDLASVMHDYRHQAHIYTEAVRRGLGRDVAAFKLFLLRLGRSVEVPSEIAGAEP